MSVKKVLPILIGLSLVPIAINSLNKSTAVSDWKKSYHVDDSHVFTQGIINTMASLIVYLYKDPSEKHFNDRLSTILSTPSNEKMPNDAKQALIKIYRTAYDESVKKKLAVYQQLKTSPPKPVGNGPQGRSPIDLKTWHETLEAYYQPLFKALDTKHRRINFGPRRGEQLQATLR